MTKEERDELERIRKLSSDGILHKQAVVDFARDPESPLHRRFDWDDTTAAAKYRLQQAGEVIRIAVVVVPSIDKAVRVYVSLENDRAAKGGYRTTVDVLSTEELRLRYLSTAINDAIAFSDRYAELVEFAGVRTAIRTAIAELQAQLLKAEAA